MADSIVHFATNRDEIVKKGKTVGFGNALNTRSPVNLRFGVADMQPAGGSGAFKVKALRIADENLPGIDPAATGPTKLGSAEVFEGLRQRLQDNRADLLLLIHGYACSMETALANAASLRRDYARLDHNLEAAVFCWPSDGKVTPWLAYGSDRDDARSSAKAVERSLLRLVAYLRSPSKGPPCTARLHLVAHSMGNYVLRNALQAMISDIGGKSLPKIFANIFLMAADEDNDALEYDEKLGRLPELADAVHVYFARDDLALGISDVTKGNPDRLGMTGPRRATNLPHKVNLIDCTGISGAGGIADANHQYYRLRKEMFSDVQQVLAGVVPEDVAGREWTPSRNSFRIKPAL